MNTLHVQGTASPSIRQKLGEAVNRQGERASLTMQRGFELNSKRTYSELYIQIKDFQAENRRIHHLE